MSKNEIPGSLRNSHIFFGIPCYGGQVTEAFFTSFLKLQMLCHQLGIQYSLQTIVNDSLVTRARNTLVAYFLGNPHATHLMFIDADIRFEPESVLKLVTHEKDVVGGAYPKKSIDWNAIKSASADFPAEHLKYVGAEYAVNYLKRPSADVEEVKDLATGFLLMKRSVIEKMTKAYGDLQYKNTMIKDSRFDQNFFALFDTSIDSDKVYLSEDYTFCRRWQKLDGKIFVDRSISLDHIGTYTFSGHTL